MAKIGWKSNEQIENERAERAREALRARRDRELRDTDWTQLPDAPLTGQEKAAWVQYRNSLRELPEQASDQASEAIEAIELPPRPGQE